MTDNCSIGSPLALSTNDLKHLNNLEKKFQVVRDRTAAVARGYSTGLFVHGNGGVGKSYTVLQELDRLEASYIVHNSRMTGKGLFNALEQSPEAIHVLEDMETITHDKAAQGVLRSACWGQTTDRDQRLMVRNVTWRTNRDDRTFEFTGGVIVTSNRPLANLPELQAIRTRIAVVHLQASQAELAALMRSISLEGYQRDGRTLAPQECMEVCNYMLKQARTVQRPLDMRVLANSYQDRLQWDDGHAGCRWEDLVAGRLNERPTAFKREVILGGRAEGEARDLEAARQVLATATDGEERLDLWVSKTGKSQATMYRCFAKLKETAVAA